MSADLIQAARAVVERWDSPKWKDAEHTGVLIARLRDAIAQAEAIPKAVSASTDVLIDIAYGYASPLTGEDASRMVTAARAYFEGFNLQDQAPTTAPGLGEPAAWDLEAANLLKDLAAWINRRVPAGTIAATTMLTRIKIALRGEL